MMRAPSVFAAVQLIVFGISLAFLLLPGGAASVPLETCCWLVLLHTVWALWSWRRASGGLFDPYTLFLLSATLFNAGLPLLEALHVSAEPMLASFPPEIVLRSALLVFGALAGLHLGALLAVAPRSQQIVQETPTSNAALRMTGSALLAISLVPMALKLREAASVAASGGYMALYQRANAAAGATSALIAAADLVVPGACFILAGSAGRPWYRVVAIVVLATYSSTLLFAGWRGHSIMPLVSVAWLWDRTIFRVPRVIIAVAGAILLAVVFPFVRATRGLTAAERATTSLSEAVDGPFFVASVEEMGSSIESVAYTVELVPSYRTYDLGVGFAYALFTVVPSLFWSRHPSTARGTPSMWLTQTVDPYTADEGGNLGFSFVADAYLNFGAPGVPLFALLMGFAIGRLSRWAEGSAARLATVATFIPYLLFSARAEMDILPRPLVWYAFCPYALYLLVRRALQALPSIRSDVRASGAQAHPSGTTP